MISHNKEFYDPSARKIDNYLFHCIFNLMEWMILNGAILGFIGIIIAELEEVEASTHKLKCKAFATKGMLNPYGGSLRIYLLRLLLPKYAPWMMSMTTNASANLGVMSYSCD